MNVDDWIELDELARSAIMLTLHKSVYFNVKDTNGAYGVWSALSKLYEKKSAASQVYWLKKLIDLRMKECTPMSNHLNEFHTIVSQLQSQRVEFDDFVRAMFLLVTLPDSWDTFCTTVSNFATPDGLKCADVESNLLMEEVNRKNVEDAKSFNAMHALLSALHWVELEAGIELKLLQIVVGPWEIEVVWEKKGPLEKEEQEVI
ncbi:hypothetical protein L7F22_023744 [Adiantum nelumboides]|nr:hypothetical protein [Adiantum nelumboides]